MKTEMRYGLPVVERDIFEFLEQCGITPWGKLTPPMALDEYLRQDLNPEQQSELRFAPKSEVLFLRQPNGEKFRGFRTVLRDWASVFTLIYDMREDITVDRHLVPIICEYKHGADVISIALPSGVPGRNEASLPREEAMRIVAQREFQEETGILLEQVLPLGNPQGVVVASRNCTQRFFPFRGILQKEHDPIPQQLDKTEILKALLIPLPYWLNLIEKGSLPEGYAIEVSAVAATYLALHSLYPK